MRQVLLSLLAISTAVLLFALNDQASGEDLNFAETATEQDYCGTNYAWQRLLNDAPHLVEEQERLEDAYYRDRKDAQAQRMDGPPYTIPVVFHIIHEGGTENISDAAIQTSLDYLNQSFANTGPYDPGTGVPTDIDFCLAKRTPEGTLSSGVERVNNALTNLNMSDDVTMKNLSRYDPTQYLNIWVVKEICSSTSCGVAGYAYFPSAHGGNLDGIVVEARWLGNTPGGSSVLTHEVGHYLGLYHTFEGGCQNDDCLLDGDRVCDTPPDQSTAAVPCNASPNSCSTDTNSGFATDQPDMFKNYMDYGDWNCYSIFTDGQRERMHFFLEGTRASLLSSQGCLDPCTIPVSVSITTDFGDFVAQGESISLTANGTNADNYTWYVDGVEVGTGNPFNYTFADAGTYNVRVAATNSDPNCLAEAEATANVRCPVQSSFTPSSMNVGVGSVVFFTNESTNGTDFEWQVDGVSAGTDMGFFYQFDAVGTYVVTLLASNGNCSDDYSVVVTVGLTGNTQTGLPIWPLQGGANGGFYAVDWRVTPPLSTAVAPISDQAGGITGAAFNSCGGTVFYAVHTAIANTSGQLFIYAPDGTPLLTNSTPNAPGLNSVNGGELQVIPVPGNQNEWYIIYRRFEVGTGAPLGNAAYLPLELLYSRVRLEMDGSLTVLMRDQMLMAGGTAYTYSDGIAVSRTVNGDASRHYLYAGRRALNQNSISLDRFIIDDTGISWESNTGTVPATYWNLTHSGSPVELSPTEDRVVVGNRNQWSNYVDYIIFSTQDFSNTSAISIVTDDLILVADGQPGDETNVLPVNRSIDQLSFDGTYPLQLVRNFPHKISRMEFSPNGRFLYLVGGGFQSGSSQFTTTTYLAQLDLETNPLQVRLQMQAPPGNFSPTTGLSCAISQCGDDWQSIGDIESSFDGNLYFSKRNSNTLFVIPDPNNFLPQRLVPGNVDLSSLSEPNIQLPGRPGTMPDQIDGFNYLSAQSQNVSLSIFGLDCAGECRLPYEIQVISSDDSYQESFTIADCPTIINVCADTSLSYRLVDVELGLEYVNAIVNGEVNAPAGGERFEFSEPQGCPEDCDEPYVYFYGEDEDYGGRTIYAHDGFLYVGGSREDEALLSKMTPAGEVVWTQTMRPIPDLPNFIVDVKVDSEGALIGVGSGRAGTTIESFAFKLNPDNGAVLWTQVYDSQINSYFDASDIFEPNDDEDYVILGSVLNLSPDTGCDASFYTINRNTGQITDVQLNYTLGSCESIWSTVESNGTFYTTGRFNFAGSGSSRMRPAIMSLNSTGTPIWSRLYLANINIDARLYSHDITFDGANNLAMLVHGDDNGTAADNNDIWIVRASLLSVGGVQWALKYTFPEPVNSKEIIAVGNGYVFLARARNSNNLYLSRVNANGELFWSKRLPDLQSIGAPGDEMLLLDNYIYLTATHIDNNNNQLALLRIDLETGQLVDDCYEGEDIVPGFTFLSNPYDGFNSISPFTVPASGIGPFNLTPDNLEPLPISCAPPCGPEDCSNGIDDDGDGLADCEDPDCDCEDIEICDNDIDDDGDGLVDCEDPDLAEDCCCYVPPTLELGNDIVRCENGVVVLDAGPDFESYQWSDLTTEQTLTTTFPGIYSVTVTDRCGNEQEDSIEISVDPASEIDLGPDVTLCPGETLTLTVDGFATYEWFPADGFDCNTCPTVTYTASESDTIIVVATSDIGCISTDTLIVNIGGGQEGSFTATDLCAGDTLTFGDIVITEAGLYVDTVGVGECIAIDSLEVSILPTFSTSEDISICAGQTADIFGNPQSIAGEYSMTFEGSNGCDSTHTVSLSVLDTFATTAILEICAGDSTEIFGETVSEAGDYSMTFTASNGCDSTHTVTLTLLDAISSSAAIEICAGDTADIFGNPESIAGEYSMTFESTAGCDSTHTIVLSVLDTFATVENLSICAGETADIFGNPESVAGEYSMTFTAENGCDSTHTITLMVLDTFATTESIGLCPGDETIIFGDPVTEAGDYSMTFTASNGCDSTHTITVVALETFATAETLPDQCDGASVEIFGDVVTESGIYSQTFIAANGCDSTHTVTVTFLPPIETQEELFICQDESVEVFGEMVDESGVFSETFTAANGCDSTHTITVIEEEFTGSANISPPCPSDPEAWIVYIRTVGNGGPYTVSWNGIVAVDNTINNIPIGDHVAVVTSANGCIYTVEFTIRPYNQPWWLLATAPNCDDPASGSISIQTEPTDEEMSFSLDGENFGPATTLEGLTEGTYVIHVKYGDRCVLTDTLDVPAPEDFSLVLPEDQVIDWGSSLPIEPTTNVGPGAVYKWYPSTTLDCSNCEKVVATPGETTRYFLQVTDANGCVQTDEILITVDQRIPYYVPNAFSPNGDGKNDYFTIYGDDRIEEVEQLIIFDRWGGQVFTREHFPPNREILGWDGRNRDQTVSPGVFVYHCQIRMATGETVMVKGDVVVLR